MTSAASTNELSGALNAAYSGGAASGSVDVSGRQQEILNQARYQVVALGGRENDALSLIRDHKLGDYFSGQSDPATAVPISYQVNNIGDDSAARFTETTSYKLTECSPLDNKRIVVGASVRLMKPFVYMNGNRGSADIYGGLVVNGSTQWSRPRTGPQTIQLHNQTELDGWRQPDVTHDPWQLDLRADQSPRLTLTGSINCKLYFPEFGDDPSNQYNWEWRLGSGAYGNIEIEGGSRSCDHSSDPNHQGGRSPTSNQPQNYERLTHPDAVAEARASDSLSDVKGGRADVTSKLRRSMTNQGRSPGAPGRAGQR